MKHPVRPIALLTVLLLAGCGGHSVSSSNGRAALRITWPQNSRLIPAAANFIRVSALRLDGGLVGSAPAVVRRPSAGENRTQTINIDQLPVGEQVIIRAEAFPGANLDADGTKAQARGDAILLIRNDQENTFDINMGSTVRSLGVTLIRNGEEVQPPYHFTAGDLVVAAVQARDADGDPVIVESANLRWNRSGPSAVLINGTDTVAGPDCNMRCNEAVTCAVVLTERESGITTRFDVTVERPAYPGVIDQFTGGGPGAFEPFAPTTLNGDIVATTNAAGAEVLVVLDTVFNDAPPARGVISVRELAAGGSVTTFKFGDPIQEPNYQERIARNSAGLCLANFTAPNTLRNANFTGTQIALSPLTFGGIRDLDALAGFTYVLDNSAAGYRVVKLQDSTLGLVSQFFLPVGFTGRHLSIDDEGSIYVMGRSGGSAAILKFSSNGVQLPFVVPAGTFTSSGDIDVDVEKGLIYVMDYANARVQVLALGGAFVQTIAHAEFGTPYGIGIWPVLSGRGGKVFVHSLRKEYLDSDPPRDYIRELLFVPN